MEGGRQYLLIPSSKKKKVLTNSTHVGKMKMKVEEVNTNWRGSKMKELKLLDLPALQGTEKQVKWAEDIRHEVIRILEECRKVAEQAPERRKPKLEKAYNRLVESLRGTVHASVIIDRFRLILKQEKMTDKINTIGKGIPMEIHNPFLVYAWNHFRKDAK